MSESVKSFLILLGGLLAVLALWYLSVLAVRFDTRRRLAAGDLREIERKAWVVAAIALPLFGFALYLFARILRRYLTPAPPEPDTGSVTEIRSRIFDPLDTSGTIQHRVSLGTPAGPGASISNTGSNGKAAQRTPATIPAAFQSLQAHYELAVLDGPHTGQSFPLDPLPVRIGRGPGAKIALDNDLNVSRNHADIYEWNGMLRVLDLGSTHGTMINGIPITDQALTPGDHLAVGGTVLILRELP